MMAVQLQYHINDQVNTALRPKRSAAWPSITTPNHKPAKVENTKVPKPATLIPFKAAKAPRESAVNKPLPIMPGESLEERVIPFKPMPLTVALEAQVDSLRDERPDRRLTIRVEIAAPASPMQVAVLSQDLLLVLRNLTRNAITAAEQCGGAAIRIGAVSRAFSLS